MMNKIGTAFALDTLPVPSEVAHGTIFFKVLAFPEDPLMLAAEFLLALFVAKAVMEVVECPPHNENTTTIAK